MNNPTIFPVRKLWLNIFLAIALGLLAASIFMIVKKDFSPILIIPATMCLIMMYQYWMFSKKGYVGIYEDRLTINTGLILKEIQFSNIQEIINKKGTYKFLLKKGKPGIISSITISEEKREELATLISEIEEGFQTNTDE
jgi:hypothetical protein